VRNNELEKLLGSFKQKINRCEVHIVGIKSLSKRNRCSMIYAIPPTQAMWLGKTFSATRLNE